MKILFGILMILTANKIYSQSFTEWMFNGIINIKVPSKEGTNSATAFLASYKGTQYLLTAKHVFPGYNCSDSVVIGNDDGKNMRYVKLKVYFDDKANSSDIAVLTGLDQNLEMKTFSLDSIKSYLPLGATIYFLGYPSTNIVANNYSISTFHNGKALPLLKKGILSGFDDSNPQNTTLIFDAQSAPGFSGSPVISFDSSNNSFYLLAVMSGGYISNVNVSNGKTKLELTEMFYLTSLSAGSEIGHARQIIDRLILPTK